MIQTIKNRIKEKKESIEIIKSYLNNVVKRQDYQGIIIASGNLRDLQTSMKELEWILQIIQQGRKKSD